MAVPTFSKLMLPLLQFVGDGTEHNLQEADAEIARYLQISREDLNELMPNSKQNKFNYRLRWAKTYLTKAGLLNSTGRGLFRITQRGVDVLDMNLAAITNDFLMQFPEYVEFKTPASKDSRDSEDDSSIAETEQTPKESMRVIAQRLRTALADELLEYVLSSTPQFFEQLVIDVLLAMGYGGSLDDAGEAIGRSGDGGIDGFIKQDKLGLDIIYVQAKRWATDRPIGRPDVQGFVGSLVGQGAVKGVFITTSRFTQDALDYARKTHNHKLILIDGHLLTQYMIEHDVGVSVEETYVVKRIDRDYFEVD